MPKDKKDVEFEFEVKGNRVIISFPDDCILGVSSTISLRNAIINNLKSSQIILVKINEAINLSSRRGSVLGGIRIYSMEFQNKKEWNKEDIKKVVEIIKENLSIY